VCLNPQNTSLNTVLGTFNATLANLETFKPRSKTHPWAVSRSLHKSTSCASLMDCVQLHEDVCVLRRTSVSTNENATGCSDRSHAGMLMTFVSRKQNNILITLATCRPDRTAGRPPVLTDMWTQGACEWWNVCRYKKCPWQRHSSTSKPEFDEVLEQDSTALIDNEHVKRYKHRERQTERERERERERI